MPPPNDKVSTEFQDLLHILQKKVNTVKALNSGHLWFSEKVSAIESCPLHRGSKYKGLIIAKENWFIIRVSAIKRCPL